MNRTVFMIKNSYKKAINKLMSASDKIDYAVVRIDEQIVALGDARSKYLVLPDSENKAEVVKKIEDRIVALHDKKLDIKKKKSEYEAKISYLNAAKEANIALNKCGFGDMESIDDIINEVETEIKTLEAELNTTEFMSTLK